MHSITIHFQPTPIDEYLSFIKYAYVKQYTHIPSSLSALMYIPSFLQSLKSLNVKFFDGKQFAYAAYNFVKIEKYIDIIYRDDNLFNALPIGLGYALNKPETLVWVNISDSQLLNGLLYESLILIKRFNIRNILVTVDNNNRTLRSNIDIQKLLPKSDLFTYIDCREAFILKVDLPSIVICKTFKGYPFKTLIENPSMYHYTKIDKPLLRRLINEARNL